MMKRRYYIQTHLLTASRTNTLQESSRLSTFWANFLFWLLPVAFVWLRLLGIDYTLHIPLMTGVMTPLLIYSSIADFRMRFTVFRPIAGYEFLIRQMSLVASLPTHDANLFR